MKAQIPPAVGNFGDVGRTCRSTAATRYPHKSVRAKSADPLSNGTPWTAAKKPVHATTAAAPDWTARGLNGSRIISKASPCKKRCCMIDGGRVGSGHMIGSVQVDRILHELVTSNVSVSALGDMRGACTLYGVRRKLCVERLESIRSIYRGPTVSVVSSVEASVQRAERRRANLSSVVCGPCTQTHRIRAAGDQRHRRRWA